MKNKFRRQGYSWALEGEEVLVMDFDELTDLQIKNTWRTDDEK